MQKRPSEEAFEHFYRTYIENQLESIEINRKASLETLKGPRKRTTVLLSIYVVFVLFVLYAGGLNLIMHLFVGGSILYTLSYAVPYQKEKKKVLGKIKRQLISKIIHFLDPNLVYAPKRTIPKKTFLEANLYLKDKIGYYKGEDTISGKIGETSMTFSEVHAQEKGVHTDGLIKYGTIFKGLFFDIDFHKPFTGSIYVTPNAGAFSKLFGTNKHNNNQEKLETVTLGNPDFQKRYLVRADNQIIARYVLSPSFMEHLLRFERQTGCVIRFSFRDGHMYLAIETNKNHFDFNIKQPLTKELIYGYFHEVKIAFDLVEELKLNTRIWK